MIAAFKTRLSAPLLSIVALVTLAACTQAPITGRDQLILMDARQTAAMGADAYSQIKRKTPISDESRYVAPVTDIGNRIAAVSGLPDLAWEFTVFEDETPNAFALPGGKVGVNTGLFKVAETEDQLATVMAHEVAHVLARHGAERMSHQILLQAGLLVAATQDRQMTQVLAQAATLGLILPFSREQEAEADAIGLVLMSRAGYDPRASVDLWRNFERVGGNRPPEFLSTHPSPGNRIQRLQAMMPQAMEIYEANRRPSS